MAEVIVIAAPAAHAQAAQLANKLASQGLMAVAPDISGDWREESWRAIVSAWPAGAFIVFCVTQGVANDPVLSKLVWQNVPMGDDPTGRFIFAIFDENARGHDNVRPFLARHFHAPAGEAAAIAMHVGEHRKALADQVKADAERRKRMEEAALRAPPPASRDGGPRGTGAADIGASEGPRRIGGEGRPPGVGGGWRAEGIGSSDGADFRLRRPSPASAPAPANDQSASSAPRIQAPAGAETGAAAPKQTTERVDALAFAPKKLRRGTTELIRVAVFQPKDRARAMQSAKAADSRTQAAGIVQQLGRIARGANIAVVLDARGAECDITRIDAEWTGAPLDFDFPIEPSLDKDVAQALITIRILADDAQVGAITFVRPLASPRKSGASSKLDTSEKLRRVERVFLSYSSDDRGPVSMIASAYQRAGIACFFDRTGLKSGEEWSPRLLGEIAKADLFHLCWSTKAAKSQWVERETAHAMQRRRKSWSKRPDITIQMLDGPPWAPHPASLDTLNFDDFARAAIVGYARGDAG